MEYELVIDENGPIRAGTKFLVFSKSDEQLVYMEQKDVYEHFPHIQINDNTNDNQQEDNHDRAHEEKHCASSSETAEEGTGRKQWTDKEITALINLFQQHRNEFQSTTIKNDRVWQKIANALKNHTAEQCKNKFKYLKAKYTEKKDLMSSRRTGEKNVKFAYYDAFEELFGSDANINPSNIASSSQGAENFKEIDDASEREDDSEPPKKKKKTPLQKQLEAYEQHCAEREASKQKRHEDVMQRQDKALSIFETMNANIAKMLEKK